MDNIPLSNYFLGVATIVGATVAVFVGKWLEGQTAARREQKKNNPDPRAERTLLYSLIDDVRDEARKLRTVTESQEERINAQNEQLRTQGESINNLKEHLAVVESSEKRLRAENARITEDNLRLRNELETIKEENHQLRLEVERLKYNATAKS